MPQQEIPVTLGTICNGDLEAEFQDAVQQVITALQDGEKGSIAIAINFERMAKTASVVVTTYSLTHKTPTRKKAEVCFITEDFHLKAEVPPDPAEKPANVLLFNKEGQA